MKMQWTLLLGLIFAIIIAIFAIVNMEKVPVDYVFGEAYWPLVLVILGSALIGALISACFSMLKIFNQSRELVKVNKKLAEKDSIILEKDAEITRLRSDNDSKLNELIQRDLEKQQPAIQFDNETF